MGQRSVLQLQRRQGQVRHELCQQCERQLWLGVGVSPEVSPPLNAKGIQKMNAFCITGLSAYG